MAVHLFILGLPGSGKSTISRYIVDYVQKQQRSWSTSRLNDYAILHEMFLADTKHEKFTPTKGHDGFDVLDLSQLDIALKEMEERARKALDASSKADLILMEFARKNYRSALAQFSHDFVCDAYFLYLKAKIPICKRRIRDRVADPHTEDDHYVSEKIFKTYYHKNKAHQLYSSLKIRYGIEDTKIKVINNNRKFEDIVDEINQFIDFIFEQEGGNVLATSR